MLSLLLSGNQAIGAFASIVNPHRAPLIAPNSPPYCGVRSASRATGVEAKNIETINDYEYLQN